MFAFAVGFIAAIAFAFIVNVIHGYMEMNFDKRAREVFEADDEITNAELDIIHKNQLPIRGLCILSYSLAGDSSFLLGGWWEGLTTLFYLGLNVVNFWIVFDIFCAVLWLGKPWWYIGNPPPIHPLAMVLLKGILYAICLFGYIFLSRHGA